MSKHTRDVVSRKLQALPGRRFSRYPKLEPDLDLGPLDALPGKWVSGDTGWNMIALPFASPAGPPFRLLLNQYKETLRFSFVDEKVPNRGITSAPRQEKDQLVVTLDYEQSIEQVSAVDEPVSGKAGGANLAIHHEPGLFLYLTNQVDDDIDIGRLASIPHGNSVLALGTSDVVDWPDKATDPQAFEDLAKRLIGSISGLPIGVGPDAKLEDSRWLAPYKKFSKQFGIPFKGNVTDPNFEGFDPVNPAQLLQSTVPFLNIKRTTVLALDSSIQSGGVSNIPFVERQADAAKVTSTFWIHELRDPEEHGSPFILQYLQDVSLDFLPRLDQPPGLIRWPHVSINTLWKDTRAEWEKEDLGGPNNDPRYPQKPSPNKPYPPRPRGQYGRHYSYRK